MYHNELSWTKEAIISSTWELDGASCCQQYNEILIADINVALVLATTLKSIDKHVYHSTSLKHSLTVACFFCDGDAYMRTTSDEMIVIADVRHCNLTLTLVMLIADMLGQSSCLDTLT